MSPLEQAARALMRHHELDPDVFVGMHGGYGDFLDGARAVLQAIGQPSERMLSDGAFQIFKGERITEDDIDAAKRVWRGMLSAAISE